MRTGWLWLRCPYFSLKVVAPAAIDSSWLPRHADAEDRELLILHRLTDVLNGSITGVGIAGTIGDKQSVELQPVEIIVPGNADDFHPPSQQTADDVGLHTAIHKDNLL